MANRVRVFIACSVDGFIAGPDNDLSWLPGAEAGSDAAGTTPADSDAVRYEDFIEDVGAMLMGRSTYDVVSGFGPDWPYGSIPVHVATHRPLDSPPPTVRAVSGPMADLVAAALEVAEGQDLYLDGGDLIRQALDAGCIDELIVTLVPVVLGRGHPLFAGVGQRHDLELLAHHTYGPQLVQLVLRPR